MSDPFSRRDFLRLAGLLPLSMAAPRWTRALPEAAGRQNVIVVVFDAWSALNVSLYGYDRETTPNLKRLARRAVVYHDHYAGSSFTTPGTASLLTGTYPWSHRALIKDGTMAEAFTQRGLFNVFEDYFRLSYTHNPLAFLLLDQFRRNIDELMSVQKLLLRSYDSFLGDLFIGDSDISNVGWVREAKLLDGYSYSLFFSHLDAFLQQKQQARLAGRFPGGQAPWVGGQYFLLEEAIDRLTASLAAAPQPFLGYFHFLPPHAPYRPPLDFSGRFHEDNYVELQKPVDEFSQLREDNKHGYKRVNYDEFILYADQQFARLYHQLETAGLLDNTWVVLTADHGEMFERGMAGHMMDALYQPVVRVPLLIFEPGRQQGLDIRTPTSAVDVLPTLAQVTGHAAPHWTEGTVLPPYAAAAPDANRNVYVLRSTHIDPAGPLTSGSAMLLKAGYELAYYWGYGEHLPDHAKLFDLRSDPQEMNDLFTTKKDVASALLKELQAKLDEVNKPFKR